MPFFLWPWALAGRAGVAQSVRMRFTLAGWWCRVRLGGLAMVLLALGIIIGMGRTAMATEQLGYDVVETAKGPNGEDFSLRAYAPVLVAEVTVSGTRKEAANAGFRLLADYIFGNNLAAQGTEAETIAMTAPVVQAPAQPTKQTIAMTAPVIQDPTGPDQWAVQFVMPKAYTLATLPKPKNSAVTLRELPARTVAAVQFSGWATAETLAKHQAALQAWVAAQNWPVQGGVQLAFYNPPWTLPWWRRNEVWVAVQR